MRIMVSGEAGSISEHYRRDRRGRELPGFRREDLGSLVRYTPVSSSADGIVCFTDVAADQLAVEIARQVDYFQAAGVGFEWKVYGSDRPADLQTQLGAAGFEAGEPELLMAFEVARYRPDPGVAIPGMEMRRLGHPSELAALVDLQQRVWGREFDWLHDQLAGMWDHTAFFAAFDGPEIVGSGWIEYPEGSGFAEIHGGAVLPPYRGRGIYSGLLEPRLRDAADRGIDWVAVDAAPMSRPILEAKGFVPVDTTCPMLWTGS
jgi:GNAT superfamily N-acetyltransferase